MNHFEQPIFDTGLPGRFDTQLRHFSVLQHQIPRIGIPGSLKIDQKQAARINDATRGLRSVKKAFGRLPEDELDKLLGKTEESFLTGNGEKRARLVTALFDTTIYSSQFTRNIEDSKLEYAEIPGLLQDEGMLSITSAMLSHPEEYRMQLGIVFSHIRKNKLPEDVKPKLITHDSEQVISLESNHDFWILCQKLESYMEESLLENTVLAIGDNDRIYALLQFKEKMSALWLTNVATKDGNIFIRGNLYSLVDKKTRKKFTEDLNNNKGRTTIPAGSSWSLMRPINSAFDCNTPEETIAKANRIAGSIPNYYPPDITYAYSPV